MQHRSQINQSMHHNIHHNAPIFELDDDELEAMTGSGKLSRGQSPSITQQL